MCPPGPCQSDKPFTLSFSDTGKQVEPWCLPHKPCEMAGEGGKGIPVSPLGGGTHLVSLTWPWSLVAAVGPGCPVWGVLALQHHCRGCSLFSLGSCCLSVPSVPVAPKSLENSVGDTRQEKCNSSTKRAKQCPSNPTTPCQEQGIPSLQGCSMCPLVVLMNKVGGKS